MRHGRCHFATLHLRCRSLTRFGRHRFRDFAIPRHDPPRHLIVLLHQWAHIIICAGSQKHEVLGLEDLIVPAILPDIAHGSRGGGHPRLEGLAHLPLGRLGLRVRGVSLHLLLRLQSLLGCQLRDRLIGVDEVGELVAIIGEVVLYLASRFVLVEPPLPIKVHVPSKR